MKRNVLRMNLFLTLFNVCHIIVLNCILPTYSTFISCLSTTDYTQFIKESQPSIDGVNLKYYKNGKLISFVCLWR